MVCIISQAVLYMYHQYQYVVGFMLTRAFARGTIYFFLRDYYLEQNEDYL